MSRPFVSRLAFLTSLDTSDILTVHTSSGRHQAHTELDWDYVSWALPWVCPKGLCPAGTQGKTPQAKGGQAVRGTVMGTSTLRQQNTERERD